MSISFLGGTHNGQSLSNATITGTYSPTAGNIVIVFVAASTSTTALSVKDSANNVLTAGPSISNGQFIRSFYYTAASGITSFIGTWTTNSTSGICILEYSVTGGTITLNPSLSGNTNSGSSATASCTMTTQDPNDFIVVGITANATLTAGTGTPREANAIGMRCIAMDNTSASATSLTCSATLSSNSWAACGIELRLITSAPSGTTQFMMMGTGT